MSEHIGQYTMFLLAGLVLGWYLNNLAHAGD